MSKTSPTAKNTEFLVPPKKFHPGGLGILHEDRDIIVVNKTNGLLTVGTENEKERTAYFLLTDYVKRGNPKSRNRIFIVHRLDRETSGVLVFTKSERAKRFLQDQWTEFTKTYYAVVHGQMKKKEGEISSYLAENSIHRMYSVTDPTKGKFCKTGYKVVKESEKYSLLQINLLTGRKNQIRVHLSEEGNPVVGDKIYGQKERTVKTLLLHASSLTLIHPHHKREMCFETQMPLLFKSVMK